MREGLNEGLAWSKRCSRRNTHIVLALVDIYVRLGVSDASWWWLRRVVLCWYKWQNCLVG